MKETTGAMTLEEVQRYIPLTRRDVLIQRVMGEDMSESGRSLDQTLRIRLQREGLLPTPRPSVPKDLWVFVSLTVPGLPEYAADEGSVDTFRVPYTAETVLAYGQVASLDFLDVDLPELTDTQIISYSGFIGQYAQHILNLKAMVEYERTCYLRWADQLETLLILEYAEGAQATKKLIAKSDPYVVTLRDQVPTLTAVIAQCQSLVSSIEERVALAKHDLRRRERSQNLDRFTHGGDGIRHLSTGHRPPVYPRGTR